MVENDTNSRENQIRRSGNNETPKRKRGKLVWSILGYLTLFIFAGVLFVGGAVFGYVSSVVYDEPVRSRADIEEKIYHNEMTGFAYFRDGAAIGQLRTEEDRRPVAYKEIPQTIMDAVIAIEDNNFMGHPGVDFNGTMRAIKQRVLKENVQTGGSTLTQQLARRVFLNLDRTDNRKIKEILLSFRLERFLSKPEIITAYLNKVPFGNGVSGSQVYGIKAAAKGIFNAGLSDLNVAQSAYLAGLPQLPSSYSAFNGKGEFNEVAFNRAIKRQRLVLQRMLEEKKISKEQYNEALTFDIKASLAPKTKKAYETYPYLMMETERQGAIVIAQMNNPDLSKEEIVKNPQLLEEGRQQLLTSGYLVYTTIDQKVYKSMHKVSENAKNFSPEDKKKGLEQVAATMIDNKTGAILGMIEGRDFYTEQMNYATQMVRQPGSTMKTIAAYLPAIELGLIQPASIIDDSPIILKNSNTSYHIPGNASGGYKGLVTARTALNESRNVPALKIFNQVLGIDKAWDFSKKLGITTIDKHDYQAQTGVLGGLKYGVTVEELTNAYSSIANGGKYNDSYMIEKITDLKGNVIYKHQLDPQRVFSEQSAYLMTDMLRTVVTSGTGKSIKSEFKNYGKIPVVGKTGSTQNYADVWFMGYTPDVSLGVWIGYKEPVNTLSKQGRSRARSIWALVMNQVTESNKELFETSKFNKPDGIVTRTVSGYSGKLPSSLTGGNLVTDIFNVKFVPKTTEDVLVRTKYVMYDGVNYIPLESTPSDMVREKVVMKREKPIKELVEDLQKAFRYMSSHRDISYYIPKDAKEDAPYKTDPRADDGRAPSAPSNVRVSGSTITFSHSPEKDVVGYRLYRSSNGGSFEYTGNTALVGDSASISYGASNSNSYSYYVTAVDVAGKESAPSAIAGTSSTGQPEPEDTDNEPNKAPATPTNISINGLTVSWATSNTATEYNIYISDSVDGTYTKMGTTSNTSYSVVSEAQQGWIKITAANSFGESFGSAAVQFQK